MNNLKNKNLKDKYITERKFYGVINDAVEKILEGVQNMFNDHNKINDEKFATKDDLKREIGFVRNDINDLRAEISTSPTRNEFDELKTKVNRLTN